MRGSGKQQGSVRFFQVAPESAKPVHTVHHSRALRRTKHPSPYLCGPVFPRTVLIYRLLKKRDPRSRQRRDASSFVTATYYMYASFLGICAPCISSFLNSLFGLSTRGKPFGIPLKRNQTSPNFSARVRGVPTEQFPAGCLRQQPDLRLPKGGAYQKVLKRGYGRKTFLSVFLPSYLRLIYSSGGVSGSGMSNAFEAACFRKWFMYPPTTDSSSHSNIWSLVCWSLC